MTLSSITGSLVLGLAAAGCTATGDVRKLAESDLECDHVGVVAIGQSEQEVPFRRSRCGDAMTIRYRAEGCDHARYYQCQQCRDSTSSCSAEGPILDSDL